MINTELLDAYIDNSELKLSYIISRLGMSDSLFRKKRANKVDFYASEVNVLCDLLHITDMEAVFFV